MSPQTNRHLARVAAVLFLISSAFPVVAGLHHDTSSFPRLWGILDVGLAFLLAASALAIQISAQGKVNEDTKALTYRAYRGLIHGILLLLVAFFLLGNRIVWINCLTGFAWRAWLLLYTLPAWITTANFHPSVSTTT